jgi:hypothetical protein
MQSVLGSDVSKDSLDVVLVKDSRQQHKVFGNQAVGHSHLQNWLVAQHAGQVHAYLDPTVQYGEEIAEYLYQRGIRSVWSIRRASNTMEQANCIAKGNQSGSSVHKKASISKEGRANCATSSICLLSWPSGVIQ